MTWNGCGLRENNAGNGRIGLTIQDAARRACDANRAADRTDLLTQEGLG